MLRAAVLSIACGVGASVEDGLAFFQSAVGLHGARDQGNLTMSSSIRDTPEGPVVVTAEGPMLGVVENGCNVFKKIPYVERPRRFEQSQPKAPWAPSTLRATRYGPGCLGSQTGVPEDEDCLNLNVWAPRGGHQDMPVIVYFHGGLLQHGSGQESLRQGDGVAESTDHRTIFINLDFRMGIFGWFQGGENTSVPANLGLHDQQMALRWVQRNIRAFGGDPGRVTLVGQSEGGGLILAHMVAKSSAGLFHRAIMHSPPADIWSRTINAERTAFMVKRLGCQRQSEADTIACLRQLSARQLWDADWVSEALSSGVGSISWFKQLWGLAKFALDGRKSLQTLAPSMGWHPVVDGVEITDEPKELIRQGKWNRAETLITVSPNESMGVFPQQLDGGVDSVLKLIVGDGTLEDYLTSYNGTGVTPILHTTWAVHQAMTDKLWICDARKFADVLSEGGGQVRLGLFNYHPRYDPCGGARNAACVSGTATCHAAEMLFSLPQLGNRAMPLWSPEWKFARWYRDHILSFVEGSPSPWVPWDVDQQVMTLIDGDGARAVPHYRQEQCDVLNRHRSPLEEPR